MQKRKTELELLEEISTKLTALTGLIASTDKDDKTKMQILQKCGLTSDEVGTLLGKSASTVRTHKMLSMKKRLKK